MSRMLHLGETAPRRGSCDKGELCLYITSERDRSTGNCTWHALELMPIYASRNPLHGSESHARKVDGEKG